MTSNGQRFRRRSLRRGYKVDEVDSFLDRVEATLNEDGVTSPVRSEEVHDAVFRVRFGGYDEWQVDLHLDRVERQLADQESSLVDRLGESRPPERERTMVNRTPARMASDRMPERMGPPSERPHMQPPPGPLPTRSPMGSGIAAAPAASGQPPHNEPTYAPPSSRPPMGPPPGPVAPGGFGGPPQGPSGYDASRHGRMDMTAEMRMPDMRQGGGPGTRPGPPVSPADRTSNIPTGGPSAAHGASSGPPHGAPLGPPPGMGRVSVPGIQPGSGGPSAGGMAPGGMGPGGPSVGGMGPGGPAGMGLGHGPAGGGPASPGEVQRIDQMRRAFQPRRFGSGYDRVEVDRLFEGIISAMSGRSAMPPNENELDPGQFNLVSGGYFESEVDQALREVRDIFRRR